MSIKTRYAASIGCFVVLLSMVTSGLAQTIHVVASTGDVYPDGGTMSFSGFTASRVIASEQGGIVGTAYNDVPGAPDRYFAYEAFVGQLNPLIESGTLTGTGFRIDSFGNANADPQNAVSANGRSIYNTHLSLASNSNARRDGIYLHDQGTVVQVAADGQTAPGGNGQLFPSNSVGPTFSGNGRAAFASPLDNLSTNPDNDNAIFRWDGPTQPLTEIIRKGDALPGGGFAAGVLGTVAVNNAGQVSFATGIEGVSNALDEGIFRADGSGIEAIARKGDTMTGGGILDDIRSYPVPINNAGEVAFSAFVNTGLIGGLPTRLYVGDGATTRLIAASGQPTPDGTDNIRQIQGYVALNNRGDVAFEANLSTFAVNNGPASLFLSTGGSLVQIAKQGRSVPGSSAVFAGFNRGFALNDSGDVAFQASVDLTPLAVGGIESALFFYDGDNGGLTEILRTGDEFFGSTVTQIEFLGSNGADNALTADRDGLNNRGEVAFHFDLANGVEGIALWGNEIVLGDYDGDGFVAQADLDQVLLNWGDSVVPPGFGVSSIPGGFDGLISQNELDGVLLNWGDGTPPNNVNAIPEPGATGMVMMTGMIALRHRRRSVL